MLGKPLVAGHTQGGFIWHEPFMAVKSQINESSHHTQVNCSKVEKGVAIEYLWPVVFFFFFQFCDVAEVVMIHKRIFLAKSG